MRGPRPVELGLVLLVVTSSDRYAPVEAAAVPSVEAKVDPAFKPGAPSVEAKVDPAFKPGAPSLEAAAVPSVPTLAFAVER